MTTIQRWISEPPPDMIFEVSDSAVTLVSPRAPAQPSLQRLGDRFLTPMPNGPNIARPQPYRDAIAQISGPVNARRNSVALVIPDYAVRMAVLDFEEFPTAEADRLSLLRFRLRKSVPFHIDEAQVSYSIELQEPKRIEILTVAIARPVLSEYESLFSDSGMRVGLVTPSCLAARPLYGAGENGLTLVAKSAGTTLSVLLLERNRIRIVRCLDLADESGEQSGYTDTALSLLQQTAAYAEDQIGQPVSQLLLCGFGAQTDLIGRLAEQELQISYRPAQSRLGPILEMNAGLLGLLEQYTV